MARLLSMAQTSLIGRLVALCVAFTFGACATHGDLNEVRLGLSLEGNAITWTVENPSRHPIVIDDYTNDDMGVPQGVWIRVTDASGKTLAYSADDEGWYSPWMMWSEAWTPEPLELAPAARFEYRFTAADLTRGLLVSEPIAGERCRYQVRVGVAREDYRAWTFFISEWREIDCSELRIEYCPFQSGVLNCTGRPLPFEN
ncbi:hypothetical protein [Terricaulis sp.]|uniref:hypothetical protein n=1 Tax=Terricaulis sp. TaxID=2768686 RepID=UPI00378445EE